MTSDLLMFYKKKCFKYSIITYYWEIVWTCLWTNHNSFFCASTCSWWNHKVYYWIIKWSKHEIAWHLSQRYQNWLNCIRTVVWYWKCKFGALFAHVFWSNFCSVIHNIINHTSKKLEIIEIIMNKFILNNFLIK